MFQPGKRKGEWGEGWAASLVLVPGAGALLLAAELLGHPRHGVTPCPSWQHPKRSLTSAQVVDAPHGDTVPIKVLLQVGHVSRGGGSPLSQH